MSRFPCIVDLDRGGEVTRDTFIPKPQHAENPSVSCHRLHSELVTLKELIRSPNKKIQEDLAALQQPRMSRDSSSKPTLPKQKVQLALKKTSMASSIQTGQTPKAANAMTERDPHTKKL